MPLLSSARINIMKQNQTDIEQILQALKKALLENASHFQLKAVEGVEQHLYATTFVIMSTNISDPTFMLRRTSLFGTNLMSIPMDPLSFISSYNKWKHGTLVQNAFPTLNADEREFILTGCLPKQWEDMFNEDTYHGRNMTPDQIAEGQRLSRDMTGQDTCDGSTPSPDMPKAEY